MNKTIKNNKSACQCIVYDNYSGSPLLVTFLGKRWWVTSTGHKLQPLEKYFGDDDVSFVTLCEAGGTVGALALAGMLGYALTNPESDVSDVMHWRVAELNRLGVTLDLQDEPLLIELDVFPNGQKSRREGKFSVVCNARGACDETLFDIDGFDSKEDAKGRARFYLEFLEHMGVRFTII